MKDTGEYNATFSDLFEKIEKSRKEQPSAGRVQGKPSQGIYIKDGKKIIIN